VVLSGYSTPSTTKTGRHDIAEILLKVALNTKNQNQIVIPFNRRGRDDETYIYNASHYFSFYLPIITNDEFESRS
jgi:hypothetical protein